MPKSLSDILTAPEFFLDMVADVFELLGDEKISKEEAAENICKYADEWRNARKGN